MVTVVLAGGVAHAGPRLAYERAAAAMSCPDEDAFRLAVEARLGRDPFGDGPAEARVSIDRRGGRWVAYLAVGDGEGALRRRTLSSRQDCEEVVHAAALALSLALDVLLGEPAAPPAPTVLDPWPPGLRVRLVKRPPRRSILDTVPRRSPRLRLGGGLVTSLGVAPVPLVGVEVGLGAQGEAWSVSIEGRGYFQSTDQALPVAILLALGSVVGCFHHRWFSTCALVGAGPISGRGLSFQVNDRVVLPYAAVGIRQGLDVPLPANLVLYARVEILVSLVRPTFVVDQTRVFSVEPVAPTFGVGLSGRLR